MTFVWISLVSFALLATAALLLSRGIKIPREPEREGYQDEEASLAYDRTSRWLIFALERSIVLNALGRGRTKGLLVDIGCGPGYLAARIGQRLPALDVLGLDLNRYMISLASSRMKRSQRRVGLILGDASALPFATNTVHIVVSSLSLHHWKDPREAFLEIYRVLAPGGRLVIFDTRRDVPFFVYWAFIAGQSLFSPRAIRRTNGAVGSLWSSYTAEEIERMMSSQRFETLRVNRGLAWLVVKAVKPLRP